MQAMVLRGKSAQLLLEERSDPQPGPGQIRVRVEACAVCRTDLHLIDGELPEIRYPIVPGHEIVGIVDLLGAGVSGMVIGQRIGIAWRRWVCHLYNHGGGLCNPVGNICRTRSCRSAAVRRPRTNSRSGRSCAGFKNGTVRGTR